MLPAVVKMSLVADLVAHMAGIGQAFHGLCADIRNWLPVLPPPLLSLFPVVCSSGPLSHAVSQCARYTAAGLLSASCSCSGTRVPEQEGCCRPLVLHGPCFSRDMLLCVKLLGLKLWANPGTRHLEGGREEGKGIE